MLVGTAVVTVLSVVERVKARVRLLARHAGPEMPVLDRQTVRARIRAEVGVERPVLLHHDDHVLDLVDADQRGAGLSAGLRVRPSLGDGRHGDDRHQRDQQRGAARRPEAAELPARTVRP